MKISLLILFFSLFFSCQTTKKEAQDEYYDLSTKIDSIINKENFNGVILITNDSNRIYSKAIGDSDLENMTKLDMKDQFVIGSISKQITAILILREFENSKTYMV